MPTCNSGPIAGFPDRAPYGATEGRPVVWSGVYGAVGYPARARKDASRRLPALHRHHVTAETLDPRP
eukprot:1014292-Rhodomonas_salina.1